MNQEPPWVGFACGSVSGLTAILIGHPLDTLKTRMQASQSASLLGTLRSTVQTGGIRSLYRGMVPPLIGTSALRSVQFGVYASSMDMVRRLASVDAHSPVPLWTNALCGGIAGTCRSIIETPLELAKVRRQTGGTWAVRSLYTGFTPNTLRAALLLGSFFTLVEASKPLRKDLPPLVNGFVTGSVCATVAWWICFPLDVVKSQIQAETSTPSSSKGPSLYHRMQHIYRLHGIRGFFRGIVAGSVRSMVGNGFAMAAYEATRRSIT